MYTLSEDNTQAAVAVRDRRRFRKPIAVLLVAGAIAAASLTAAQPASAYTYSVSGSYNLASITPMYINSAGALNPGLRQLAAPTIGVRSTLAAGSPQWQTVVATFTLQRYNSNTRTWTDYWYDTRSSDLRGGQSVNLGGVNFGNWARGYYYRTVVTARWTTHKVVYYGNRDPLTGALLGTVVSTATGSVVSTPSTSGDQACNVVHCTSYPGYAFVN